MSPGGGRGLVVVRWSFPITGEDAPGHGDTSRRPRCHMASINKGMVWRAAKVRQVGSVVRIECRVASENASGHRYIGR